MDLFRTGTCLISL